MFETLRSSKKKCHVPRSPFITPSSKDVLLRNTCKGKIVNRTIPKSFSPHISSYDPKYKAKTKPSTSSKYPKSKSTSLPKK